MAVVLHGFLSQSLQLWHCVIWKQNMYFYWNIKKILHVCLMIAICQNAVWLASESSCILSPRESHLFRLQLCWSVIRPVQTSFKIYPLTSLPRANINTIKKLWCVHFQMWEWPRKCSDSSEFWIYSNDLCNYNLKRPLGIAQEKANSKTADE